MGWLLLLLLLQQTQSGNCGGSCTAAARNCQRVAWPQSFDHLVCFHFRPSCCWSAVTVLLPPGLTSG